MARDPNLENVHTAQEPTSLFGHDSSEVFHLFKMIEMDKTTLGAVLLIIGIAILVESLFADAIGIGGHPSFGRTQTSATIVGAIMVAGGLFLMIKAK